MSANMIKESFTEAASEVGSAPQGGNRLRALHLLVGAATLLAFFVSGVYLLKREPPLSSLERGLRFLYRSRHIYILAAATANLLLGSYGKFPLKVLPDVFLKRLSPDFPFPSRLGRFEFLGFDRHQ